jgi:hypothetical protein
MAELLPSYDYVGNEIIATIDGTEIARGTEFSRVAATAEEYLNDLRKEREKKAAEERRRSATHITTPNGLKGEVLSRVEGIWGEEITVRLENGQHRRYVTAAGIDDVLKYSIEEPDAPKSYREYFERKINEEWTPNREGLLARIEDLDHVRTEASRVASTEASATELNELHKIVLTAEAEMQEVKEALDHLNVVDAENAAPAAPVYAAVEQADLGNAKGDSWLDVVANEMVAESEQIDFDKLASEGPALLVSDLDDGALTDAGVVRETALAHVIAKTAGFQGEKVEQFRERFVAAAEGARRRELTYRQENHRREASAQEEVQTQAPDEALFL